ncbi:hypothetical protein HDV01_004393 [Terramyces sp. JEL0728]|nr:hypothetical protein HDV01_004393 [Terramyces sp. JEL0728]
MSHTVASELHYLHYHQLRFAISCRLPKIPKLTFTAYKSSTKDFNTNTVYTPYPVQLLKEYYGYEAFKYLLSISDFYTWRDMLDSHSVPASNLQEIIQDFIDQETEKPMIGWEIYKYLKSINIVVANDFYIGTLYFQAATMGYIEIVKDLMSHPLVQIIRPHSEVFVEACQANQIEVVELLLEQPFVDINYQGGEFGRTGFVNAAAEEYVQVARLLFAQPDLILFEGDLTEIFNCQSYTDESMEIFYMLMSDSRCIWNEQNNGPIRTLAGSGMTKAVEIILKRDDIDPSADSNRAAMMAAWNGKNDVLKLLLQHPKVNPFPAIFVYPCRCNNTKILEILMMDPKAHIEAGALGEAIRLHHHEIIERILMQNFADLSNIDIRAVLVLYCINFNKSDVLTRLLKIGPVVITAKIETAIVNAVATRTMLEKLKVELEVIGSHLVASDYLELQCSFHNNLSKIPVLALRAFKDSTVAFSSEHTYPVKLSSDYFGEDSFNYAIEIEDLETVRNILKSHCISKSVLEKTIQTFIDANVQKPKIGWEITNYLQSHHNTLINDFYSSILYCQSARFGHLDIFLELMHHPTADVVHSQNEIFVEACKFGSLQMVRLLIDLPVVNVNYLDQDELTGFTYAILKGNVDVIKHLLNLPVILNNGDLTYAVSGWLNEPKYEETLDLLMADNRPNWNETNNGPINCLCSSGNLNAIQRIFAREDFDRNTEFNFAANNAAYHGHINILEYLFANTSCNPFPDILTYPCQSRNLETFEYLVKDPRANVNENTIYWAMHSNAFVIMQYITDNSLADLSNSGIRSVLASYSISKEQGQILPKLLKIGPIELTKSLEAVIYSAVVAGKLDGVVDMLKYGEITDHPIWEKCSLKAAQTNKWKLVEAILDCPGFAPSYKKNQLLRHACENNMLSAVKKIVQHPNFRYKNEDAPFMALVKNSNAEIMKFMLESVKYDPAEKRNLLFRNACKYSSQYFIKFLLNVDGIDPADLNYQAVVNLLSRKDKDMSHLLELGKFKVNTKILNSCKDIVKRAEI